MSDQTRDNSTNLQREPSVTVPELHHVCKTEQHVEAKSGNRYTQSFRIIRKRQLFPGTFHFSIEAPMIARKIEAGQFIIVRPNSLSERIPLSICGWDREEGTIQIIVAGVGKTTLQINSMDVGDRFIDVVGPLGERSVMPSEEGTCVVIGGGYGTGAIIPVVNDLRKIGRKVVGIIGARSVENVIMENELRAVCTEVVVTTNDGSRGTKGLVTDALKEVLAKEKVAYILAIGPVPMMKAVSDLTRDAAIPTYVSLNAIMVDGTGMCGACRVTVGTETKFACFHGPEFEGHKVDFDNLMKRQKMFAREEKAALTEKETNILS
jgi:ferredoxin/flavodoxin---NADP+ reductase